MFDAEARWLCRALDGFAPERRRSPLLEPYRDEIRRRPRFLLGRVARFPAPFVSREKSKHSTKLYWLIAEYRITCAVFEKL